MSIIVAGFSGCIEEKQEDKNQKIGDQKDKNMSVAEKTGDIDKEKKIDNIDKKIDNIEKIDDNTDADANVAKEIYGKEYYDKDWYKYTYIGPSDTDNSENARMSIIPHLQELGWNGGINVAYGDEHVIIIALPFQLTTKSIDYINQTLANFSFRPDTLNEIVR